MKTMVFLMLLAVSACAGNIPESKYADSGDLAPRK